MVETASTAATGQRATRVPAPTLHGRRLPAAALVVIGLYVASAFLVPTLAPVGLSDDFLYARSVDILRSQGELVILPATAVTLVFQAAWGVLFTAVFGHSFGVLRVATVAFTVVSAGAVYGLCRELRVDPMRSGLGALLYLFNPLQYVLSFSFMTDAYFAGMVAISAFFYARGLREGEVRERWVLAGSVAAALAFLIRHQGVLVPLGVATYLFVSGRLRRDRRSLRLALQVLLVPAVAAAVYFVWFRFIHGVPENSAQDNYFEAWSDAGIGGVFRLARRLLFAETLFVGFFVLPLALGVLPRVPSLVRSMTTSTWVVLGVFVSAVMVAAATFGRSLQAPYFPGWVASSGLGPRADLRGGRLPLVDSGVLWLVTGAIAVSALVTLLVLCRRLPALRRPGNTAAGVVLSVLLWQALGVLGPSMILRDTAISYDRYLLPLLPLVICLTLWSLRSVPLTWPVTALAAAAFVVFSVGGTHDYLRYQSATWDMASAAHAAGAPYDRLDGGAAWDGEHLYEYSLEKDIAPVIPKGLPEGPLLLSEHDVAPWWLAFYAPAATENDYIVSAEPLAGFTVVRRAEYSSWLEDDPTYIYLLRHPDAKGPP